MTIKLVDKKTKKVYEAMKYNYKVTDEFIKFVGIKSFSESCVISTSVNNGEETNTETKKINFTFSKVKNHITMLDGYYFVKNVDNEDDWMIVVSDKALMDRFKLASDEIVDKDTDIDFSKLSNEAIENVFRKLFDSQVEFMNINTYLIHIIEKNLKMYGRIKVIDEVKDEYNEALNLCDRFKTLFKVLSFDDIDVDE